MQAKLNVGPANDPFEQEADRLADRVMRMPSAKVSVAPAASQISRKCEACEEEQKLQTKRVGAPEAGAIPGLIGEAPAILHQVLCSPGQPLDAATRAFFEPRFGHEFARVRVHTGERASASARGVGALAYAAGSHIVFAEGQFAPATNAGKVLLAHELVHVLQQTGPAPWSPGHSGEPESKETGGRAAEGEVPSLTSLSKPQEVSRAAARVSRRVVRVNCPPNQDGAPADPRKDIEAADQIAIEQATNMATGLATDSETVSGGIPAAPSATLQAYENHFGLPVAAGSGFLNRLTGKVRATQETALSEELAIVSKRFAGVARLLTQGLNYTCPGHKPLKLVGCTPFTCGTAFAFSCPDVSLVALCSNFWTDFGDGARGQTLIHESMHVTLGDIGVGSIHDATTRGAGRNFNIANCYEALVADITGVDSSAECPAAPAA